MNQAILSNKNGDWTVCFTNPFTLNEIRYKLSEHNAKIMPYKPSAEDHEDCHGHDCQYWATNLTPQKFICRESAGLYTKTKAYIKTGCIKPDTCDHAWYLNYFKLNLDDLSVVRSQDFWNYLCCYQGLVVKTA